MIHDKVITFIDSEKGKIHDDQILTGDIEEVKTVKQSAQINEENVHHISDERSQMDDYIQINDDGNEYTMIYDE